MKVDVFLNVASRLDDTGVEWWLSDGTALGCHREGGFIASDLDIDIGVWKEDMAAVSDVLPGTSWRDRPHQLWRFDYGVKIDVHGHERRGDIVFFRLGSRSHLRYEFPARLFERFESASFYGWPVLLPSPIDEYLTVHYGAWQTPTTQWRWDASPPCLRR